ncbi:MAG: valine--tRNA ligase [Firmicutes bacterium]|nr:valine--tRNA ligase [Bacillota bacterium]
MEKNFDFARAEAEINKKWLESDMFNVKIDKSKKPFTIIMPPPNITSRLHIGHAFDLTIQDAIIRFKRMQGFNALLLPGADHAAIATEVKVVEELRRQGIEKSSLTKAEFMKHIHKWYEIYTAEIRGQMEKLGLSCDWSRFSFTMDTGTTKAVNTVFHSLYNKGLIYQGERMINYCTTCQTALSDAEVEHSTRGQQLYNIMFPFVRDEQNGVTIATVRPEVIFGDAAIAVHPGDKRYKNLIGKMVYIPLTDIKIPIIADEIVDKKFGTGILQITPAHSHADFDVAKKHGLDYYKIFDAKGTLIGDRVGEFGGMTIPNAREAVITKLKVQGLLKGQKNRQSNIGECYRCKNIVEPALSNQWFMAMSDLAKPAIAALKSGELKLVPKKFEKVYLHWLNNIKDWCISRQLTSGHKIPIDGVEDVLDTWFSSALWPFSTLGWPNDSADYKYFYPTDVLVTAYDIIFFWVIRMVFSGIEHTGKLPFNTVLLHGLVRDKDGKKMSKSLGNGIDPLDVINEFGTDALRFSLIVGTKLERDPRYSLDKAVLARNFINKIWNAVKFYLAFGQDKETNEIDWCEFGIADKWIMTKFNNVVKSVIKKYEKYDFGVAANELQSFFWNDFCDWYLECVKVSENKQTSLAVFRYVLFAFMKLVHPIMPFVTEEIFCNLNKVTTISFEKFPEFSKSSTYPKEKRKFDDVVEVIQLLRAQKGVQSAILDGDLVREKAIIEKLGAIKIEFGMVDDPDFVTKIAKIRINIDEAEKQKQISKLKSEIERGERMLGNVNFVAKAPSEVVAEEQEKLASNRKLLAQLQGGAK